LALYTPELVDTELDCQYLLATQPTPPTAAWLDHVTLLWRVGHSQPVGCDALFKVLSASTQHDLDTDLGTHPLGDGRR